MLVALNGHLHAMIKDIFWFGSATAQNRVTYGKCEEILCGIIKVPCSLPLLGFCILSQELYIICMELGIAVSAVVPIYCLHINKAIPNYQYQFCTR